jgi:hypothetical protein
MTPYAWPVYQLRHEFTSRPIASAFGLVGLTSIMPYLERELYSIHQSAPVFWLRVGTAARFENGRWVIMFDDGREIRGCASWTERDPQDFVI